VEPTADAARHSASGGIALLAVLVIVANPGVLLGGLVFFGLVQYLHVARRTQWLLAVTALLTAFLFRAAIQPVWFPLLFLHHSIRPSIVLSVLTEALLGPITFVMATVALFLYRATLLGQVRFQRAQRQKEFAAIHGRVDVRSDYGGPHPDGLIRLGRDAQTNRHFDLRPSELNEHVFIPGASGSGKTTTVGRLADGALHLGYSLVVVDCKGGDLKHVAKRLAERYSLPFFLVDPDDKDTLGFDPCSGEPADISNKLVGVFNYSGGAEIYKHAAQQIIPAIARAIDATGQRVTLTRLTEALSSPNHLKRLGRDAGAEHEIKLADFAQGMQIGTVTSEAYIGLGLRFGALLEGKFRDLFTAVDREEHVLDWDAALAQPCVTYIALRATASSEDVDLMSRMIAQDLKQVCSRRIQDAGERSQLVPALCVMDEFAALNEAGQFRDLLLQSRQALMPTVISTQIIPESLELRQAALGAGLIIAHRLAGDDAEDMAAQFGTHNAWKDTVQHDFNKGTTGMMSLREVREFNRHPDEFRELPRGRAAVRCVSTDRRAIVQIYPMS
jgi:hypothetical protein